MKWAGRIGWMLRKAFRIWRWSEDVNDEEWAVAGEVWELGLRTVSFLCEEAVLYGCDVGLSLRWSGSRKELTWLEQRSLGNQPCRALEVIVRNLDFILNAIISHWWIWGKVGTWLIYFFFFFKIFFLFDVNHFKRFYRICYNMASVLCFGFSAPGMWGFCSLTWDWTQIPCFRSQSLNHWTTSGVLWLDFFFERSFWLLYRDWLKRGAIETRTPMRW